MKFQSHFYFVLPLILALNSPPVHAADNHDAPIYRITVVQRSLSAVNYGRRSGTTEKKQMNSINQNGINNKRGKTSCSKEARIGRVKKANQVN